MAKVSDRKHNGADNKKRGVDGDPTAGLQSDTGRIQIASVEDYPDIHAPERKDDIQKPP